MLTLKDARELAMRANAAGNQPRVHPNGFIQLDLEPVEGWDHHEGHSGANRRLHIWNPPGIQLARQGTVNEIHDHVFDMRSTIVRGVLSQRRYAFVVGGIAPATHELYRAVYGEKGSRLEPLGLFGIVRGLGSTLVHSGHTYLQPALTFHDSVPANDPGEGKPFCVVTIMEKTAIVGNAAHVIVPRNSEPDNDFNRAEAMPESILWDAIDRSLSDRRAQPGTLAAQRDAADVSEF